MKFEVSKRARRQIEKMQDWWIVRRVVAIFVLAVLAVLMPSSASASITPAPEARIGNFELREPALIGFVVSR